MSEIKKYRKKPVEVDAIQIHTADDAADAADWIRLHGAKSMFNRAVFNNGGGMLIDTLEGSMIARQTDFVVKGVEDEFYPVRADIFWKTYEESEQNIIQAWSGDDI